MLGGIRDVLIISNSETIPLYQKLFGDARSLFLMEKKVLLFLIQFFEKETGHVDRSHQSQSSCTDFVNHLIGVHGNGGITKWTRLVSICIFENRMDSFLNVFINPIKCIIGDSIHSPWSDNNCGKCNSSGNGGCHDSEKKKLLKKWPFFYSTVFQNDWNNE